MAKRMTNKNNDKQQQQHTRKRQKVDNTSNELGEEKGIDDKNIDRTNKSPDTQIQPDIPTNIDNANEISSNQNTTEERPRSRMQGRRSRFWEPLINLFRGARNVNNSNAETVNNEYSSVNQSNTDNSENNRRRISLNFVTYGINLNNTNQNSNENENNTNLNQSQNENETNTTTENINTNTSQQQSSENPTAQSNSLIFRIDFSIGIPHNSEEIFYQFVIDNPINNLNNENTFLNLFFESGLFNENSSNRINQTDELLEFFSFISRQSRIRKKTSKQDLDNIKTYRYKTGNINNNAGKEEECGICYEDFKVNEKVRMLRCEHFYHCRCVDKWLLNFSTQCPICRKEVKENDESNVTEM